MGTRTAVTDEWVDAASGDATTPFSVEAAWGSLAGVIVPPPARRRWIRRPSVATAAAPVAFVAPAWPGPSARARSAQADDALCAGLLRGGAAVARVSELGFAGAPSVHAWLDAIVDGFVASTGESPRPGIAGTWFAGTACALLSSRIPALGFLVCAGAPSAEVMSRRTPETEDDPAWDTDPDLRLADALAALSPLEAVTVNVRPSLFVQGSADGPIGTEHLDAWCAALAATGRPADSVEVAFADALFSPIPGPGGESPPGEVPMELLAGSVAAWTARVLRGTAVRRDR